MIAADGVDVGSVAAVVVVVVVGADADADADNIVAVEAADARVDDDCSVGCADDA